jgi:signal transduction histidine kinase/ActR/RegA family two-component response regulator
VREIGADHLRRARTAVLFSIAFFFATAVGAITMWLGDAPDVSLVYAIVAVVFISVPVTLKLSRSVGVAANHLAFGWLAVAFGIAITRGGIVSPAIGLAIAAPMIATLLVGARAGIAWALVAITFTMCLLVLKQRGVDLPDRVPLESRAFVQAIMASIFTIVLLAIALAYEFLRNAALAEVAEKGEEVRRTEEARLRAETEAKAMNADRMASIGRLAAGIAHEINNPLTYLLTNLQLIRESIVRVTDASLSPELRQSIDEAIQGATNIRNVVRDLKTFARSDEESLGAVDVRPLLESTIRMIANAARHRARIVCTHGEIGYARANPSRLAQVFLNVLLNASEAIPFGDVDKNEIKVTTMPLEDRRMAIEISDTGCGIAPENIARVTEPFFTTKPPGQATGLGLSVCQNILRQFDGRLEIESVLGRGTTVRIILGCHDGPLAKETSTPVSGTTAPPPKRARILIIDDDEHVAKVLARLLREHDVMMTHNSRQAIALLETRRDFDLVFCDLIMPERTGMDIYQHVQKIDPAFAARMVFISGGVFDANARAFVDSIQNRFLEKPFDRRVVTEVVETMLKAIQR